MHVTDFTEDKKILVTAGGRAEFKVWLLEWNETQNTLFVSVSPFLNLSVKQIIIP